MKKIKILLLSGIFVCFTMAYSHAQKFGHLNSQILLMEMPEIKAADQELEDYRKSLVTKGEEMVKAFETKYNQYVTEANSGTLSSIQMQTKESELREEQAKIREYEVEVQQKIAEKREVLYKPLFDKVKQAIQKIGKEQGYTMILDSSMAGAIVHADTSNDIIELVRTELGL